MPTQTKQVILGKRNQITLPKEFIPDNISMFECERMEDGSILLTPHITIPITQAYFWTPQWQKGEIEASKNIEEGELKRFNSGKALFEEISKQRTK